MMLDFLIDLTRVIIGAVVGFIIVYSLVRLAAIAWHKTKREYDTLPPEPKRQNDKEFQHGKEEN